MTNARSLKHACELLGTVSSNTTATRGDRWGQALLVLSPLKAFRVVTAGSPRMAEGASGTMAHGDSGIRGRAMTSVSCRRTGGTTRGHVRPWGISDDAARGQHWQDEGRGNEVCAWLYTTANAARMSLGTGNSSVSKGSSSDRRAAGKL